MNKNKEIIRKIYSAKCVVCSANMDQIHHINGNNTDNSLSNLVTLCPNCHARAQISLSVSKLNKYSKKLGQIIKRKLNKDAKNSIEEVRSEIIKDKRSAEMMQSFSIEYIKSNMIDKAQKYYSENIPKTYLKNEGEKFPNELKKIAPELIGTLENCEIIIQECRGRD